MTCTSSANFHKRLNWTFSFAKLVFPFIFTVADGVQKWVDPSPSTVALPSSSWHPSSWREVEEMAALTRAWALAIRLACEFCSSSHSRRACTSEDARRASTSSPFAPEEFPLIPELRQRRFQNCWATAQIHPATDLASLARGQTTWNCWSAVCTNVVFILA